MVHPYGRAAPLCDGLNILTTAGQTPFIPFRVPADGIPRPP